MGIRELRATRSVGVSLAVVAAFVTATLVGVTGQRAWAEELDNCVVQLVPISDPNDPGPVETDPVDLGCYATYAEAVEVGTGGGTQLPAGITPSKLTQRMLNVTSDPSASDVLIGTEYTETDYALSSRSYFTPQTCSAGTSWEVSYVGNAWNDDFESGRGFGGCDTNKKFKASNFGGDVLTCTPSCLNYGALKNEVSSLRWKP
jgi:hypothetical protein